MPRKVLWDEWDGRQNLWNYVYFVPYLISFLSVTYFFYFFSVVLLEIIVLFDMQSASGRFVFLVFD
jgi:hypothetical protein